jgi:ubiquinone/menaquinone biosynthesis C-methylase UbiE
MPGLRVSREFSLAVQYVLDQWLPPVLRDARWFMWLPMRLLFGRHAAEVMDFKKHAFTMSKSQFSGVYERMAGLDDLQGETDLNQRCTEEILRHLEGETVLEVGAGRGYLANLMSQTRQVTASDILISDELRSRLPQVAFAEANAEQLPFGDASFDTVVCTHTLEHVQRLDVAISELRRVARRRLIVVVPKQRPYLYGFSLHINFFPYAWSLQGQLGHRERAEIRDLGDWFYLEDMP